MKILIVGAGDVGHYLCQSLSEDGHNVTLIEQNEEIADDIEDNMDVVVVRDNGASAKALARAGVASADFFLAMTAHDQLNVVACSLASQLGAKATIARVHDEIYADNSLVNYQKHFRIDVLINPEALTAVELAKHVRNPERMAIEDFARGQIELQEIKLAEGAKVLGKPLKDIKLPAGMRIAYLQRGTSLAVPNALTTLQVGDNVTIIGTPENLLLHRRLFSAEDASSIVRVVLYGATDTSAAIIKRLINPRFKIRVIEPNLTKCKEFAERFSQVTVINGSATSLRLLEEEQIGSADYFIACTKDDEENVMTCLQTKKLGVKNVELVINKPDYEQVLQNISGFLDIAATASPRKVCLAEIKKRITDKPYTIIGKLLDGEVEFIELKISPKSESVGKKIRELKLPSGCMIAALVHDDDIARVPSADDAINAGDHLILILNRDVVKAAADLFI